MSQICCKIHHLFSRLPKLEFPFDGEPITQNGIYVLFEKGELAHQGDRIVRIGTHTGNNRLLLRLNEHFITENKDRSIFRKNIGRAILNKINDSLLAQWEIDLTTTEAKRKYAGRLDKEKLKEIEKQVTKYIQANFCFVVFKMDGELERRNLESKIISTVSLCEECNPSENWLGLHSPKNKIRESGLWLEQGLYKEPLSENDYKLLEANVLTKDGSSFSETT